jgi:hypothetical protein
MRWKGSAEFSLCRTWRYRLDREFLDVPNFRRIAWLMLNPSTADEMKNDPTVNRTCIWSSEWGFRFSTVINVYAFRSPKPKDLWTAVDPIGPLNDQTIMRVVSAAELVICAWGVHAKRNGRAKQVIDTLLAAGQPRSKFKALVLTKDGIPGHPLYLEKNPTPFEWIKAA